MIMAGASGGTVAILIAMWAQVGWYEYQCTCSMYVYVHVQVRYRTESVNANEIANGVLSALVAISAGCAFVDYWAAILTGCKNTHIKINIYNVTQSIQFLE